jgi:hypothetical protein
VALAGPTALHPPNPEGCAAGMRLPAADVVASGLRCQALPRIADDDFAAA